MIWPFSLFARLFGGGHHKEDKRVKEEIKDLQHEIKDLKRVQHDEAEVEGDAKDILKQEQIVERLVKTEDALDTLGPRLDDLKKREEALKEGDYSVDDQEKIERAAEIDVRELVKQARLKLREAHELGDSGLVKKLEDMLRSLGRMDQEIVNQRKALEDEKVEFGNIFHWSTQERKLLQQN